MGSVAASYSTSFGEMNKVIRAEVLGSWGAREREQEVTQLPGRVGGRWVYALCKIFITSLSSHSAEHIETHKSNIKAVHYCQPLCLYFTLRRQIFWPTTKKR